MRLKRVAGDAAGSQSAGADRAVTAAPAAEVAAPLVADCFANLECRVVDRSTVQKYCLFVLEVVKAWHDSAVANPRTIHHLGCGNFMVAGECIKLKSRMK